MFNITRKKERDREERKVYKKGVNCKIVIRY